MLTNAALPDFFRRLWRVPTDPPLRGRKSTLDLDGVVDAAIRLADRDGLEAATLPKVAKELDVTAMSLYRHIGSKHELLLLMMDAASEPVLTSEIASGWRDGLRSWAHDLWFLYQNRPWLPRVPVYQAPSGPHQMAWLERGLAQLASTNLTSKEILAALTLLSGFVRHSALLQGELEEGRKPGQAQTESEHEYGAALNLVISAEQFPHISTMLASEALGVDPDQDGELNHDFTDGLELILDGLAARINSTSQTLSR